MLLRDKVVIISGIGPGLGIKLAVEAAREGARAVVCAARTPARLDAAEAAIKALGAVAENCSVLKLPTDINDATQCNQLVQETVAHYGRIDALINSAYAHGNFDRVAHSDLDTWHQAFETNVIGTLRLTQAVIAQMKQNPGSSGGAIVMINTMATRKPYPGEGAYAASKAAQETAARYLAQEVGRDGIRVNSIFMGWMWGVPVQQAIGMMAQHQQRSEAEVLAGIEAHIPLGKMVTDDDCARAALMLASDYARAITGACLDANGGEYMR
ncbi:MAG: SDR family oxidoreductase [Sterolibacterium sp.]|nr:SDR family oxidoreductase [Sterolibacterium sp.]